MENQYIENQNTENQFALAIDHRIAALVNLSERTLGAFAVVNEKVEAHAQQLSGISSRMDDLEHKVDNITTITSQQAKALRKIANVRVRELLPTPEEYIRSRSQYYSWLWNAYQDAFSVTSYLDTRRSLFDVAKEWLMHWAPIRRTELRKAE